MCDIKFILLAVVILVIGLLIFLESTCCSSKIISLKFDDLRLDQWLIAIATVMMVIVSCQMANIAKISANQDKVRLEAELRPYLIIELRPAPNIDGRSVPDILPGYLERDGNSRLFFTGFFEGSKFLIPFVLKNVGRIPAINVKATYTSPSQPDVPIQLGDNAILSDAQPTALYHPHVNVSTILNNDELKSFNIFLEVTYKGNEDIDPRTYHSLLNLSLSKNAQGGYDIINKDFRFISK